jgi:hypothetical protein
MNTMTLRDHATTTIATALLFWGLAALLVITAHDLRAGLAGGIRVVEGRAILAIAFATCA